MLEEKQLKDKYMSFLIDNIFIFLLSGMILRTTTYINGRGYSDSFAVNLLLISIFISISVSSVYNFFIAGKVKMKSFGEILIGIVTLSDNEKSVDNKFNCNRTFLYLAVILTMLSQLYNWQNLLARNLSIFIELAFMYADFFIMFLAMYFVSKGRLAGFLYPILIFSARFTKEFSDNTGHLNIEVMRNIIYVLFIFIVVNVYGYIKDGKLYKIGFRVLSMIVLATVVTGGIYVMKNNYKNYLTKAIEYQQKGDYENSLKYYDMALERFPNDGTILNSKGWLLIDMQEYKEALILIDKAIELNPDDSNKYLNKGNALATMNRLDDALYPYEKALELEKDNFSAHFGLGYVYNSLKEYDKALEHMKECKRINEKDEDVYMHTADIYFKMGEHQKSYEEYMAVLKINPEKLEAYLNAGYVLHEMKNYDKALKEFDKALKIDKEYIEAYYGKSRVYAQLNDIQKTVDNLKICIESYGMYKKIFVDDDAFKEILTNEEIIKLIN